MFLLYGGIDIILVTHMGPQDDQGSYLDQFGNFFRNLRGLNSTVEKLVESAIYSGALYK